ncbi:MAG TPA: VIT and VWA domain-containing protein [Pyrinomonadaceae bacterium]|jgi:Ca-activated chloride channel family protein
MQAKILPAFFVLFGFFPIFFAAISSANAQGVIVPIICDRLPRCIPPPRPLPRPIILPQQLPVKSIKLDTKINNQVATTHVEQIFRNDTDATLEGTYFFPIPESASISEFAIWENDKRLVGEVRTREEARRIYESIVRRQRDPGLLEYAGKDLFQATVFPIPPRSDKKLEIVYTQVLKAENETVAYRYPLGVGKNPVPIGTISGKIEIESKDGLRNVYSPSHQIDTRKIGENRATLSFETSGKREPDDFQLFYGVTKEDFGLSLLTYREPGKDGYFLLLFSPRDAVSEQELSSKDIVFVLDTSGSMADEGKMEKARKALLFGIQNLRDGDRFNVVAFAGEERLMETGLIRADAAGRTRGLEFVKNLRPNGGTNINDALRAAIRQFNGGDRPKMLVFMTDGLPTVSETNPEKIVANVAESRKSIEDLRLFTFGVGYDVNTFLLDKLAAQTGGAADYVEPKEDLEIKVSNFFAKVSSPVLTDIGIDWGVAQIDLIYPRKMPDLFKGTQIALIGRYRNDTDLRTALLKVTGKNGKETRTFFYENLKFPRRDEKNDFLPRLWATRRVGWLLEQIRANGENKELRDEIVDLGTRFGIVTPYTSYLATDGSLPINGRVERESLDLSFRNTSPAVRAEAKRKVEAQSGADAVKLSKQQTAQQSVITVNTDDEQIFINQNVAQQVGTKTFYQQSGFWQDAEFKPETKLPEIKVQFASDEYFTLLTQEKELAQFFALGEQVVVVHKGKVYRVVK